MLKRVCIECFKNLVLYSNTGTKFYRCVNSNCSRHNVVTFRYREILNDDVESFNDPA